MQTRRDFVAWVSALSLAGLARPLAADGAAEDEAEAVARAWLTLVDENRWAASWDETAPVFKQAVSSQEWRQALASQRVPLGRCLCRRRLSRKLVESLPGAPKGPYVVIQLQADFEGRKAVETITPVFGADRRWRVSGYFIR